MSLFITILFPLLAFGSKSTLTASCLGLKFKMAYSVQILQLHAQTQSQSENISMEYAIMFLLSLIATAAAIGENKAIRVGKGYVFDHVLAVSMCLCAGKLAAV